MLSLERGTFIGYGSNDRRCVPLGFSGNAVARSYSCHAWQHRHIFSSNVRLKGPHLCVSRRTFLVCARNSDKRNPDFSRRNMPGSGFPRGRNMPNQESEDTGSMEETHFLSKEETHFLSKNGPLFSSPTNPRFQATATPGQKEKEIVELFRKVQAQLRERAANKEEKRIETAKGHGERGSVDSLLKLLRKHSFEQGIKQSSSTSDSNIHPPERDGSFIREPKSTYFGSTKRTSDVAQEPSDSTFTRPPSQFRRKSPVPRVKYQPIFSADPPVTESSPPTQPERRRKNPTGSESGLFSATERDEQLDAILESLPSETDDDISEPADHEISVSSVNYPQIHSANSSASRSSSSKHRGRGRQKKIVRESNAGHKFVPALDEELTDDEISEPSDQENSVPVANHRESYPENAGVLESSSLRHRGIQRKKDTESDGESDFAPVLNEEFDDIPESLSLGTDETDEPECEFSEPNDEISMTSPFQQADISTMKLSDLKTLAKKHRIKGASKLKKSELLKLLQGEVG